MNRFFLFLGCFCLYTSISFAQSGFGGAGGAPGYLQDIKGQPIDLKTTSNLIGNPYLYEDWRNADIKMGGLLYKKIPVKLDLIKNVLYFKDQDGTTKSFPQSIDEFTLNSEGNIEIFRKGFPKINQWTSQTYFKVVYDGSTKLLQRINKYTKEIREYNAASTTSKIVETKEFYVQLGKGELAEVKLNKKSILGVLSAKQNELSGYLQANKLDFSNFDDLNKIFTYYDSLSK